MTPARDAHQHPSLLHINNYNVDQRNVCTDRKHQSLAPPITIKNVDNSSECVSTAKQLKEVNENYSAIPSSMQDMSYVKIPIANNMSKLHISPEKDWSDANINVSKGVKFTSKDDEYNNSQVNIGGSAMLDFRQIQMRRPKSKVDI